jgi:hypothetical protein
VEAKLLTPDPLQHFNSSKTWARVSPYLASPGPIISLRRPAAPGIMRKDIHSGIPACSLGSLMGDVVQVDSGAELRASPNSEAGV